MRTLLISLVLFACGGSPTPAPVPTPPKPAEPVLVNVDADGVILGGHDAMAYRDGAPVEGAAEHVAHHDGATYRFATAEHKTAFEADPAHAAPGFGGYCAYAASQGRLQVSDPEVFEIYEGRLLVFTNQAFLELFDKDRAGTVAKANANWPGLVAKHGKHMP